MFPDSVIDQRSIQAYLETDYHVHGDAPVTLNIGVANAILVALHKAQESMKALFRRQAKAIPRRSSYVDASFSS